MKRITYTGWKRYSEIFLKISIIPSVAVLFIDDGSKDKGLELVKEVCERNEHFYYISLARNTGLSGALKAGFDNTWSKYVGLHRCRPADLSGRLQPAASPCRGSTRW